MSKKEIVAEGIPGFDWDALLEDSPKLVVNKKLSKGNKIKVYSHAPYAEELLKLYEPTLAGISTPVVKGDLAPIIGVSSASHDEIVFQTTNFDEVYVDMSKEKRYLDLISHSHEEFIEYMKSPEGQKNWISTEPVIFIEDTKPYIKGSLYLSHVRSAKIDMINEIKKPSCVYTAKVLDKNNGGFIVQVNGIEAFLPGSLAAANKIVDFDEYIGKEIPVMIEDYLRKPDMFIVSNKKYINHILPTKLAELDLNKKYTGKVTGSIKFGIFVEFNEIFTGLLHKTEMSADIKTRFHNKDYRPGAEIEFWIKEITKDNKIILTANDPSVSFNDAYAWWLGKTVLPGKVINNFKIGSLVEFAAGQVGLISRSNLAENKVELRKGEDIEVIITKIDKKSRKIFLDFHAKKTN